MTGNRRLQAEMRERSGRQTVPQIFVGNNHIGGSDDLIAAINNGRLDEAISQFSSAV